LAFVSPEFICFLPAFYVLFLLKPCSLLIPVRDRALSSQMKYVTLDTKRASVKYRSKQTICIIDGNFVPERVTEKWDILW
jgi:hypothetical protein